MLFLGASSHDSPIPLIIVGFLLLGSLAYWISWRCRFPPILLLLAFGFSLGPWLRVVDPDALLGQALFPLVSAAVAIVLFEGGLTLRIRDLREAGIAIWRVTFVGAFVTATLTAFFAWWLLDFRPLIAALLGALLSVTGPTVIGPMLRTIRLPSRLRNVAKWEGILIDPVGVLLAVFIFEVVSAGSSANAPLVFLKGLGLTLLVSTALAGIAAGSLMWLVRHRQAPEFLHNQFVLTLVLGTFFLSNQIQEESGLVTVTLFGALLANQRVFRFEHIIHFKENLRTLLISGLFLILAARVDRETLSLISVATFLFLAALVLIVRPSSIFLSTIGTELSKRERMMLMMLAPRGIVATALATVFAFKLQAAGAPEADLVLAVTLLVVTGTVITYGLGAGWVARKLELTDPNPGGLLIVGAHQWARQIAAEIHRAGGWVALVDSNPFNVASAHEEGLRAYLGNVMSAEFVEDIDISSVGWAVCLTSNNEINTFARTTLKEFLERTHIFRLAPEQQEGTPAAEDPLNPLFGRAITFHWIRRQINAGGSIEGALVQKACKADECRSVIGCPECLPLFGINRKNGIHVFTERDKHALIPGDTLVFLRPAPAEAHIENYQEDTRTD